MRSESYARSRVMHDGLGIFRIFEGTFRVPFLFSELSAPPVNPDAH
jgi:hypothetical protein